MRRLKTVVPIAGMLLLILSAASMYVALKSLSALRPAEDYEDLGVRSFEPYAVYPVQVQNTGASGRDRRMNPTKTVYMVYYRATDGSGYKWSDEALTRDLGEDIVEAGETVRRRVLSIPSDGTYITVGPEQTAGSYAESLRGRYTRIVGFAVLYIFFYIDLRLILWVIRLLRKKRAENAEPERFHHSTNNAPERFSPEIADRPRPRRRGRAVLLVLMPVILLLFVLWAIGHGSSDPVDLDYGWSGNTWTCEELELCFDLPAGGAIFDAGEQQKEREKKFGRRGSAGQTVLTVGSQSEGSNLDLLVVRTDPPTEDFLLKMVNAYAAGIEGAEPPEAREDLMVGGRPWRTWRMELPGQGRTCWYLYRQDGEYALSITSVGPMPDTPPAILACFQGENSISVTPANTYLPPVNEAGYCVLVVPPSLMGNKTQEELLEEWQEDLENVTPENKDQVLWEDLRANEDGGVSYFCTQEQYQRMKQLYYDQGTRILPEMFGINPSDIIKRISYEQIDENGVPWGVGVWIGQDAYAGGSFFSDFIAQFVPATVIGRYQLMCGVPAEEWAVHVITRDAETKEVLFEIDYPVEGE